MVGGSSCGSKTNSRVVSCSKGNLEQVNVKSMALSEIITSPVAVLSRTSGTVYSNLRRYGFLLKNGCSGEITSLPQQVSIDKITDESKRGDRARWPTTIILTDKCGEMF